MRSEVQHRLAFKGFDGNDIPEVFGNDVSSEKVDVVLGVVVMIAPGFDDILVAKVGSRAFHLHPPEGAAEGDERIVGVRFSPRLGDAKVETRGAGNELSLGSVPSALAVGTSDDPDGDVFRIDWFTALSSGRQFRL
jgi:hypothetical protein